MCTDHNTETCNDDFRNGREYLQYFGTHEFRVFPAVRLENMDFLPVRVDQIALHTFQDGKQRGFSPADFGGDDQFPVVRHIHDRLDGEQGTNQCCGVGYTPAALQIVQIVYCKAVGDLELVGFAPGKRLVE